MWKHLGICQIVNQLPRIFILSIVCLHWHCCIRIYLGMKELLGRLIQLKKEKLLILLWWNPILRHLKRFTLNLLCYVIYLKNLVHLFVLRWNGLDIVVVIFLWLNKLMLPKSSLIILVLWIEWILAVIVLI